MDSFTLPSWSEFFDGITSTSAAVLPFVQQQNRAEIERRRLEVERELALARVPVRNYGQLAAAGGLSLPSIGAALPRGAVLLLVLLVLLLVLRK